MDRERGTAMRWRRVPDAAAAVLLTTGALCAVAAVSVALGARIQPIRHTITMLLVPAPANLGYAAFVVTLAAGLANRKRVAYWMVVGYLGVRCGADVLILVLHRMGQFDDAGRLRRAWFGIGLTSANLVLTLAALGVLALAYDQFYAKVQRASVVKAVGMLAVLLSVFAVAGWGLVEAFPGSLGRGAGRLSYAAREVTGGAFGFDVSRQGRAPGWVNLILGFFGAVALFVALYTLLRSQRAAASLDAEEERRVRALLSTHGGRDSLGYFATRRDKEVIFSASGKAAVTYRVLLGVSLASGDPIGDPEAWPPAIDRWLREAREYAWTPAVMGASEAGAMAYARAGLRVIELGDEAILQVGEFDLGAPEMRQVRQAVNRIERAGYTIRIRRHCEIETSEMTGIIELAARWRDTETERGYSMALGRLGDPADGRCVLVEAHDAAGREVALLSFAPWGEDGLSLDLMRRDRASDNGLVETMVAAVMREAPRLGVTRVSLNFAVFRAVFESGARIGAGPVLRGWRALLLFFSRWFQLESLYRSNVKYRPRWVPRYLCFEDVRDLAKVGLASIIAEGFLVVPRLRTLLSRGTAATGAAGRSLPAGGVPVPEPQIEQAARHGATARGDQTVVRLAKVDALRAAGVDPYPPEFARTHPCGAVVNAHPGLPPDTVTGEKVAVAGRVILLRDHGKLAFATIRDWSGDLQVMLSADRAGAGALRDWKAGVDLGDQVGVRGEVITTHRGELTVQLDSWAIVAKCLHPLPDKHRGLSDPEVLVRQRHLDLIINPSAREMLRVRSATLHALRCALVDRGFLEAETPILQRIHGGANARPFVTHSNAYDARLYLRIAPELYLKRLAVGGVEKVFELGRDFRNEGADGTHNPEFTMLEAYEAFGDYVTMRYLVRDLILAAATAAYGKPVVRRGGVETDLDQPWPVIAVHAAISQALGVPIDPGTPVERLSLLAETARVPLQPGWNAGQIVLEMYERLVEARTVLPTFYTDFPTEVSPLTRAHRDDPRVAERWDLVAFGMELGTAYTELVDPVELRRRLTAQSLLAAQGDPEAMELDEDFLAVMEYAMPPTGGLGLGVDRLVMLLTGRPIRETVAFPMVKTIY